MDPVQTEVKSTVEVKPTPAATPTPEPTKSYLEVKYEELEVRVNELAVKVNAALDRQADAGVAYVAKQLMSSGYTWFFVLLIVVGVAYFVYK